MQDEAFPLSRTTGDANVRDNELWQIARRRAAFKIGIFSYATVNCMLIAIWYFSSGPGSYFWPIWPLLGWGIGIATQYFHAYHGTSLFSTEREYEKLKNQEKN
ncbi:2TM domain-containing protein [Segetibacter aerophilus]|uniref:2TM domain-containing protein n=1 Tax=Segetibacter aerophilus TaxID=670293 RepID=A0A512BEH0_9BACT|nr:2TM domain-containing protein [Segetibacter aerophilus]GEO10369.1 hypothetical protein SAE01_28650 [Segetibacter aerophilus]